MDKNTNQSAPTQPGAGAETGGHVLLALPGGGDRYYQLAGSVLLRHAQAHEHLLLHHSAKTRQDHLHDIGGGALLWAVIGLFPIGIIVFWVQWLVLQAFFKDFYYAGGDWNFLIGCLFVLLASYGLYRLILWEKDRETVNWGWECKKWIHTGRRKYVVEMRTFGRQPGTKQTVKSLDDMALLASMNCFWESGSTYDIDLIDAASPPASPRVYVSLHMGCGTAEEARTLGEQLAALWKIPFHNLI